MYIALQAPRVYAPALTGCIRSLSQPLLSARARAPSALLQKKNLFHVTSHATSRASRLWNSTNIRISALKNLRAGHETQETRPRTNLAETCEYAAAHVVALFLVYGSYVLLKKLAEYVRARYETECEKWEIERVKSRRAEEEAKQMEKLQEVRNTLWSISEKYRWNSGLSVLDMIHRNQAEISNLSSTLHTEEEKEKLDLERRFWRWLWSKMNSGAVKSHIDEPEESKGVE